MNIIRLGKFGIQSEKDTTELQNQIDSFIVLTKLMGYNYKFITGYENGISTCFLSFF